jgi:hypothetical protein
LEFKDDKQAVYHIPKVERQMTKMEAKDILLQV